jgi:hypothetical protein
MISDIRRLVSVKVFLVTRDVELLAQKRGGCGIPISGLISGRTE